MRVWIDLANSPQVLFFRPIIAEMTRRGHAVIITTRPYAQTIELVNAFGFKHTILGQHSAKGFASSLVANLGRVVELTRFVSTQSIDVAVSHNAYSQIVAARLCGIPCATTMDYEHQPINHLAFRLANRVIVPEPFPESSLRRYGARGDRVVRYAGIKEQMYLSDFVPDPAYRQKIGLPHDQVVVVLRPPATWASYHPKKNELMAELIDYLSASDQTRVVFLPRIAIQKSEIAKWNIRNFWIPDHVLDGPNLIHSADVVISAGGTMNRESAVLGTPTYTIFAGQLGAVDQYLINGGRMKVIARAQDFPPLKRCESARNRLTGKAIIDEIANAMLDVAKR